MRDTLGAKLQVFTVAILAFGAGLAFASGLGLTPRGMAADGAQSAILTAGRSPESARRLAALDFTDRFPAVAREVSPAVVTIEVEKPARSAGARFPRGLPSPFDEFFRRDRDDQEPRLVPGTGSGFVISPDGYIVTNNHVVEGAERITVKLADRREVDRVTLVGTDPTTDVALLKIEADGLRAAPLGRSDSTRVGEWVLAIGSPGFGADEVLYSTVTAGIVSAKGRNIGILRRRFLRDPDVPNLAIEDFIQTDAVINRGNSGGPLVNMDGEVVGMNTAIMSETGTYQGYGFAVPIELVRQVVEDLMEHGEVRRAVLGVLVEEVNAADARYFGLDRVGGAMVQDFSGPESPAREAGLRAGDVIVAVDGEPVRSVSDLQRTIRAYEPGETVRVEVVRRSDKSRETLGITLTSAESPESSRERRSARAHEGDPLGIEVSSIDRETRSRLGLPEEVTGVAVTDAARRSPLARSAALPENAVTIIQDVNGREIRDPGDYREAVAGLEPGDVVNLKLFYATPGGEGQHRFVSVEVPGS